MTYEVNLRIVFQDSEDTVKAFLRANESTDDAAHVAAARDTLTAVLQGAMQGAVVNTQLNGVVVASDATSVAIAGGTEGVATFTRTGGTSFVTLGFRAGQTLVVSAAEDDANNGSYLIESVSATEIIVTTELTLTDNATDTDVVLTVPNETVYSINV